MMKNKFSLTAILGATALATGVLFANPAVSCPLQQVKDFNLSKNLPSFKFNQLNPLQIGMLGVGGVAAVASAGWLVNKKIKETTDKTASLSDDVFQEAFFPIYVPREALETNTSVVEEEADSIKPPTSIG